MNINNPTKGSIDKTLSIVTWFKTKNTLKKVSLEAPKNILGLLKGEIYIFEQTSRHTNY